jgi:hypothetical protein
MLDFEQNTSELPNFDLSPKQDKRHGRTSFFSSTSLHLPLHLMARIYVSATYS